MMRPLMIGLGMILLAGCGDDVVDPPPDKEATWQIVFQDQASAFLSMWSSSASDVWAVGSDAGDGKGPIVAHYDGTEWTRLETGASGDLWWVHGFAGGPIYMAGTGGLVLRYEDGSFETMTTPGTQTVFGIWGPAPDDLWAVGGAGVTTSDGFIWRYDGADWVVDPATTDLALDSTATVFKVWGRSASDVYMVGTDGLILHDDGSGPEVVAAPEPRPLFTVHGTSDVAVAVGGFAGGTILEDTGGGFVEVSPPSAPQMTGVFLAGGKGYAAGVFGSVMERVEGSWAVVDTGLSIPQDFHSVTIDDEGGVWLAGGQTAATPLVDGVLAYYGSRDLEGATLGGP